MPPQILENQQSENLEQNSEQLKSDEELQKQVLAEEKSQEKELDMQQAKSSVSTDEQIVVFGLQGEEFAVRISEVLEITKLNNITRVPNSDNFIRGVINLRGRIHVVIDLCKKLHLNQKQDDDDTRVIVVETGSDRLGIVVDNVREVLKILKDSISGVPGIIKGKIDEQYLKGVISIDKRLIILLDLTKIINEDDQKVVAQIQEEQINNS